MHSEREFMHAKHGSRPKYAFGERIHARRTCLMPPFLRAERGGRMGVWEGHHGPKEDIDDLRVVVRICPL